MPTWQGWVLLILLTAGMGSVLLRCGHSFLAVDQPVRSEVLVVEGWIPDYAIKRAVDFYKTENVKCVLLVGGTILGEVEPEPGDNYACKAMKRVRKIGGDVARFHEVVTMDSVGRPGRDRTYASAIATKRWLKAHGFRIKTINVVTVGPHARRSRLLFEKALGSQVEVGVIAVPDREYDAKHWWRFSEGVKEVLSEGAAYVYARLFFHPA